MEKLPLIDWLILDDIGIVLENYHGSKIGLPGPLCKIHMIEYNCLGYS
jgi:hypothetical protein